MRRLRGPDHGRPACRGPVCLIVALWLSAPLFPADQISIALCNRCGLPESLILDARAETERLFEPCEVKIAWCECKGDLSDSRFSSAHRFIVRLLPARSLLSRRDASVDALGRAFLDADGRGEMADVYLRTVQDASDRDVGDTPTLIGYVLAHELGHLILGPGHTRAGVMRQVWSARELGALRRRWLKFTHDERKRIRVALGVRARQKQQPPPTRSGRAAVFRNSACSDQ